MTDKQEIFCKEYLIDLNATRAAIRAGYSKRTANRIGYENLSKIDIQEYIAKLRQERAERLDIDATYVLKQAVKLHERCMQDIKVKKGEAGIDLDENGDVIGVFEFNASGAAKALELIGKHVGVQAFKENINHSGEININWNEQRMYEAECKTDGGS